MLDNEGIWNTATIVDVAKDDDDDLVRIASSLCVYAITYEAYGANGLVCVIGGDQVRWLGR